MAIRDILRYRLSSKFDHVLRKSGYRNHHASFYDREYSISFIQSHQINDSLQYSILSAWEILYGSNIKYTDVHGMVMEDVLYPQWKEFMSIMGD